MVAQVKRRMLPTSMTIQATLEERADAAVRERSRGGLERIRTAAAGRTCGGCYFAPVGGLGVCLQGVEVRTPYAVACGEWEA
jgi:hypothetical protein